MSAQESPNVRALAGSLSHAEADYRKKEDAVGAATLQRTSLAGTVTRLEAEVDAHATDKAKQALALSREDLRSIERKLAPLVSDATAARAVVDDITATLATARADARDEARKRAYREGSSVGALQKAAVSSLCAFSDALEAIEQACEQIVCVRADSDKAAHDLCDEGEYTPPLAPYHAIGGLLRRIAADEPAKIPGILDVISDLNRMLMIAPHDTPARFYRKGLFGVFAVLGKIQNRHVTGDEAVRAKRRLEIALSERDLTEAETRWQDEEYIAGDPAECERRRLLRIAPPVGFLPPSRAPWAHAAPAPLVEADRDDRALKVRFTTALGRVIENIF